jgi:hypothetical protein
MKQWWPVLIVSLLVLSGCGATKTAVAPVTPTAAVKTTTLATSLKDLLAGGKEEKCTWTTTDEGGRTGVLYVSGKKFKQEITMTDAKTKAVDQLYSLSDGESIYTWGSTMGNKGVKISLAEMETLANGATTGAQSQSSVDMNKQYQYQCEPWTVNETDLALPTNITFTDMSNQMKQLEELRQKLGK